MTSSRIVGLPLGKYSRQFSYLERSILARKCTQCKGAVAATLSANQGNGEVKSDFLLYTHRRLLKPWRIRSIRLATGEHLKMFPFDYLESSLTLEGSLIVRTSLFNEIKQKM
jgi:hypothetical protein